MMHDIAALQHLYGADYHDERRRHRLRVEPRDRADHRRRRRRPRAGGEPRLPDDLGRRRDRHVRPVRPTVTTSTSISRPAASTFSRRTARRPRRRPELRLRARQRVQRAAARGRPALADRERHGRRRRRPHIRGNIAANRLAGGGGHRLRSRASAGRDRLIGGAGDDFLAGGGAAGRADRRARRRHVPVPRSPPQHDRVARSDLKADAGAVAFERPGARDGDLIDLSAIDANARARRRPGLPVRDSRLGSAGSGWPRPATERMVRANLDTTGRAGSSSWRSTTRACGRRSIRWRTFCSEPPAWRRYRGCSRALRAYAGPRLRLRPGSARVICRPQPPGAPCR